MPCVARVAQVLLRRLWQRAWRLRGVLVRWREHFLTTWWLFRTGCYAYWSFFFFFQAEDGIRDYKVTGVQTCALPILPERVDFHRLPVPGRDHAVADARVHPGQLHAGSARGQQLVRRIHLDAVMRPLAVPADDLLRGRIELFAQEARVTARLHVGVHGLEHPERRVH